MKLFRSLKTTILALGLSLLSVSPLVALPENFEGEFDQFVEHKLHELRVPGAVVGVVSQGEVVFCKGYGIRTHGLPEAVDTDTIFQLASVTKPFTSALIAMLVEEKKMDWDQPVAELIPNFRLAEPFATNQVTARDLLTHRSGLPEFSGDFFDDLGYSEREVLDRLQNMPLSEGFRERAAYSNVGFFIAGEAAATAAGASNWESLIEQRFIKPLKMTRTGFWNESITPAVNVASPHILSPEGQAQPYSHFDAPVLLASAGLMTSSGRDMTQWLRWMLDPKLQQKDELFSPVIAVEPSFAEMPPISDSTGFSYSPGWGVYYYQNHKILEKGGARTGMRSIVCLVPEKELGVVILSNLNGTVFPEAVRARVLAAEFGVDDSKMQAEIAAAQPEIDKFFVGLSTQPTTPPRQVSPISVDPSQLVGLYESSLYGTLEVVLTGRELYWHAGKNRFGGRLYPLGQTTYLMDRPPGEVAGTGTFVVDESGHPIELQTESFGNFQFQQAESR